MTLARLRVPVPDALVAASALVLAESQVWLGRSDGGDGIARGSRPAEALVLAVPALALAGRRAAPTAAAVAVGAAAVVQVSLVAPYAPFLSLLLPLLAVDYANAAYGRARLRLAGLAGVVAGAAAVVAWIPQARTTGEVLFSAVVVTGGWLVGDLVRQRQRRADVAEASRERWAQAAVADERARIARELHDVVAHSVSLMGVQAGAARLLLDEDPARTREALTSIEAIARESVAELQRLLTILRTSDGAQLEPQPGLADLPGLISATRAAGLEVDLVTETAPTEVGPGEGLAAYRIVQEALTNVVKHARATRAEVRVAIEGETLRLEVSDDGRALPAPPRTRGHGLIGMRERVLLYGGTLEAEHRDSGGFRVLARLPLGERAG